jgi:hypothetical protein
LANGYRDLKFARQTKPIAKKIFAAGEIFYRILYKTFQDKKHIFQNLPHHKIEVKLFTEVLCIYRKPNFFCNFPLFSLR